MFAESKTKEMSAEVYQRTEEARRHGNAMTAQALRRLADAIETHGTTLSVKTPTGRTVNVDAFKLTTSDEKPTASTEYITSYITLQVTAERGL
jgi:hypothetical protein